MTDVTFNINDFHKKECDGCGHIKPHQGDNAYCIECNKKAPPISNLYVPLEEVKEFLKSRRFNQAVPVSKGIGTHAEGWVLSLSPTVIDELDTLPTIDPLATIDEMIEEKRQEDPEFQFDSDLIELQIRTLQEIKSRLYPNK